MAAGKLLASGALDHVGTTPGGVCGTFKAFPRLGNFFFFLVVDVRLTSLMQSLRLTPRVEMPVHGFACLNWRSKMSAERPMRWGQNFMSLGCSKLQGKNLGTLISL